MHFEKLGFIYCFYRKYRWPVVCIAYLIIMGYFLVLSYFDHYYYELTTAEYLKIFLSSGVQDYAFFL